MSVCQSGEICKGSKHLLIDGHWQFCTCYYLERRERWFREGGFPSAYEGIDIETAATGSLYKVSLTRCKAALKFLFATPKEILFFRNLGAETMPIASWFAWNAALFQPVFLCSVRDMVDDAFTEDQRGRKLKRAKSKRVFLVLRIGHEVKHSWNTSFLIDLVNERLAMNAPTVISVAHPLTQSLESIYGASVIAAILERSFSL